MKNSQNNLPEEVSSYLEGKFAPEERKRRGNLILAAAAPELLVSLKGLSAIAEKTEQAFHPEKQSTEEILRQFS